MAVVHRCVQKYLCNLDRFKSYLKSPRNSFTAGTSEFCGEYFVNRSSTKNIQYPYSEYSGHFCLGLIYSRKSAEIDIATTYSLNEIDHIPAVINDFVFFAAEKWKIASDKSGSGNTANKENIKPFLHFQSICIIENFLNL